MPFEAAELAYSFEVDYIYLLDTVNCFMMPFRAGQQTKAMGVLP